MFLNQNDELAPLVEETLVREGAGVDGMYTIRPGSLYFSGQEPEIILWGAQTLKTDEGVSLRVQSKTLTDDDHDRIILAQFDIAGWTWDSSLCDGFHNFTGLLVSGGWYPDGTDPENSGHPHSCDGGEYCAQGAPHTTGLKYMPPRQTFIARPVQIRSSPIITYGLCYADEVADAGTLGLYYTREAANKSLEDTRAGTGSFGTITQDLCVAVKVGTREWRAL